MPIPFNIKTGISNLKKQNLGKSRLESRGSRILAMSKLV